MDIIFTKHAQQRIQDRSFSEDWVIDAVKKPDSVIAGKQKGTLEYMKKFGRQQVTAIVKENEKRENIVLSCWIDPPIAGTADYKRRERYRTYRSAPWWRQLLMDIFGI